MKYDEAKLVKLGREMITQAEENKVFAKDDAKWNTCVAVSYTHLRAHET